VRWGDERLNPATSQWLWQQFDRAVIWAADRLGERIRFEGALTGQSPAPSLPVVVSEPALVDTAVPPVVSERPADGWGTPLQAVPQTSRIMGCCGGHSGEHVDSCPGAVADRFVGRHPRFRDAS
jgi:hypothetical protein